MVPRRQERKAKPVSERDFLAGETPRVFETPSLLRRYASTTEKNDCLKKLFLEKYRIYLKN